MNRKIDRGFVWGGVLVFAALSSGCVVSSGKYAKLQNQQNATQASLAESQKKADDLAKQAADLQARITPLEKERDQLKAQLQELAETLKTKEEEFSKLLKRLQSKISDSQMSLEAASNELADYLKQAGTPPAATAAPATAAPSTAAPPKAPKQIDRPAAPTDAN